MHDQLNILVVEDHKEVARALCRLITKRIPFAECRLAYTFQDGLRMANEVRADLTLLDIHLPDATLDEVVTAIPQFPEPIVVVTEMDDPDGLLMEYCFAYGAENFFSKRNLLKTISTWDTEMTSRQLVLSIASAHFRHVMPERRHLFQGGLNEKFKHEIEALDAKISATDRITPILLSTFYLGFCFPF
jgi:CheY-like chemotaxis protein